jgi:hypothetical protein
MLKPALARGELHCVGATTLDEYRRFIEKDAALERRFQKIIVGEPTVEATHRDFAWFAEKNMKFTMELRLLIPLLWRLRNSLIDTSLTVVCQIKPLI